MIIEPHEVTNTAQGLLQESFQPSVQVCRNPVMFHSFGDSFWIRGNRDQYINNNILWLCRRSDSCETTMTATTVVVE